MDFRQARTFPNKHYDMIFVKIYPYPKKLWQKNEGVPIL